MKPPFGVRVLGLFCVVWGLYQLAEIFSEARRTVVSGTYWRPVIEPVWLTLVVWGLMGFLCVIWVVIGVGLWMLRAWARNALVFLMALSLSGIAIHLVIQQILPDNGWSPGYYVTGAIAVFNALCIVYMYRPRIKRLFGA